jgi:hypothetical protein
MLSFGFTFLVRISLLIVISSQLLFAAVAPSQQALTKLSALGDLGRSVGTLITSKSDPTLSAVLMAGLQHPRIQILSLSELQHNWSSQFMAIAVVENRPFSAVHIRQMTANGNFNDDLTKKFLEKEKLGPEYFWVVLPKTPNRNNVMLVAHELSHVYVQKFFDDNARLLHRRYPELFVGTQGRRFIMDSNVYTFLTELFARYSEFAYFHLLQSLSRPASIDLTGIPYLKRGDTFAQFRVKATQFLIEEYQVPREVARAWANSPIFVDMISYAQKLNR